MPVSVVVGGQFGSEGKGKVAHAFAERRSAVAAVRVGGSNSGHTVVDDQGKTFKFRHLPTAAILPEVKCVIGAGSYIDVDVLLREIEESGISDDRVIVDPNAVIVSDAHKQSERELKRRIGSTGSGTGAAVADRVMRKSELLFASADERIKDRFVASSTDYLRDVLRRGERVVVEGTQGFGLSVLHSEYFPKVTSRDTTAAAFISESGLSPLDVDEVVMVIRAFPIRVAGDSGPLPYETNWETLSYESGAGCLLEERTTVTNKIRRIAKFDPSVVRAAIAVNQPSVIVLNHLDYVEAGVFNSKHLGSVSVDFLRRIESLIEQRVDYVGTSPRSTLSRNRISADGPLLAAE